MQAHSLLLSHTCSELLSHTDCHGSGPEEEEQQEGQTGSEGGQRTLVSSEKDALLLKPLLGNQP